MSVGQIKKDLASLIQNHIRIKESSEIENFILDFVISFAIF